MRYVGLLCTIAVGLIAADVLIAPDQALAQSGGGIGLPRGREATPPDAQIITTRLLDRTVRRPSGVFGPRFAFEVFGGAVFAGNSPELKGFGQNLDLSNGWFVGGGPVINWPAGSGPLGPLTFGLGIDAILSELQPRQITNQNAPGVLPVNGHFRNYIVAPKLILRTRLRPRLHHRFAFSYGIARRSIKLVNSATNNTIVTGNGTAGTFGVETGFDFQLADNILLGLTGGYRSTGETDATVTASGQNFEFGRSSEYAVAAHLVFCLQTPQSISATLNCL